jgi:hypothetical protein
MAHGRQGLCSIILSMELRPMIQERPLLSELEGTLLGIISAITQTPSDLVRQARVASSIATAKVTGVATSAGIFGLVSTLGTAGTGTAIGTLSGAASTSATLAWIGGLFGGGMAAGAVVLPAVGIAAGAAAAMVIRKKFFSRQRTLADLQLFEKEILFATDNLLWPLGAIARGEQAYPSERELRIFAHDGLRSLITRLRERLESPTSQQGGVGEEDRFASTLTPKFYRALVRNFNTLQKQYALLARPKRIPASRRLGKLLARTFRSVFRSKRRVGSTTHLASVALAVTFQRLLSDKITSLSLEQNLVLDALRRSTNDLEDASVQELADYVQGLSSEALRGVMSNTKGIYHEMLFVQAFNAEHSEVTARLMEATNYPGADVQFIMDGDVISEVQLKAVSSPALVHEHLRRYPDIDILATEETAAMMDGIDSSGFRNAILSSDVANRMFELKGEGLLDEVSDSLLTSALVRSGFIVWSALRAKRLAGADFGTYLKDAGVAVGTATMLDGVIALSGN